jgi:hypothetical protein
MTAHSQIDGREVHYDEDAQAWVFDDTGKKASPAQTARATTEIDGPMPRPPLDWAIRNVLARWTEIDTGDAILDDRMDVLRRAMYGNAPDLVEEAPA